MIIASMFVNNKKAKLPKCPPKGVWLNKLCRFYIMQCSKASYVADVSSKQDAEQCVRYAPIVGAVVSEGED